MSYTKQVWADNDATKPLSAARMGVIEQGILAAHNRGGSVVVASSDMPANVKESADFVCDGTADEAEINLALNMAAALASRDGATPSGAEQRGEVKLTGGRFNIASPIQMRTATRLMGSGVLTELRAVGNTGTGVITLATVNAHLTEVCHLWINGNSSSGGSCGGIDYDMTASGNTSSYPDSNPDSDHFIHHLWVNGLTSGAGRNGIKLWASGTANNRGNIISDIQMRNCTGNGIELNAASDSFISNCHVGTITGSGYRIATGNVKISNCKSFYCDTYGLYISSGRGTLAGFETQDDEVGLYITASDWTMSALTVDTPNTVGLKIGAGSNVFSGVSVFNRGSGRYATTATGIQFDATYTDLTLVGRVGASNVTTKLSGSAGSRSFVRVSDGSTLTAVG